MKMAIKVVFCGLGKMGASTARLALAQKDLDVACGVSTDAESASEWKFPIFKPAELDKAISGANVFVDFTGAEAAMQNLPKAARAGLDLVIGTTGFSPAQLAELEKMVAENNVSAVLAPNFSVGVNLFFKFAGEMAKALGDYDVEIIEAHHNQKKDSPSGTAVKVAKVVADAIGISETNYVYGRNGIVGPRKREIGIHAVRAGDIVGEHTVLFAGNFEQIKLSHVAQSRDCFAKGALLAVRWIAGKRDGKIHSMADVLGT